ncbi:Prolyl 4-hydroxylase subunit alpha-2 [Orchesella cincta]|uniref:procollagen-proline 4-dioxygenase n=1 Tax=Orchesella cincta TaxID=48709 RepID=A0A1D2MU57_ORCCI|nr:Prolyl 4-hydroxylase subunit alpha-2 [Orchesella cincta]
MSFSGSVWVIVPFYLLLTFVVTAASEQCGSEQGDKPTLQTLSEELNKTEGLGSVGGQACKAKRETGDEESEENWRIETGLDFIRENTMLRIDEDLYFGLDEYSKFRRDELSLLELVRTFIREVKGVRALPLGASATVLSGDDTGGNKPAWCFYPYQLKNLAQTEVIIYEVLRDFYWSVLKKERKGQFLALDSYLKDIEESSLRAITYVEYTNEKKNSTFEDREDPYLYIATHPLLLYRMVRRFAEDLQPILLELEEYEDLISDLYDKANPDLVVFPNHDDLTDALESIKRIQEGTNLNTLEFATGKMDQLQTDIHVNALHALEIGAYYFTAGHFAYAVEWMYYALNTVSQSSVIEKYPIIERFFRKSFDHLVEVHNQNWEPTSKNYWNLGVFHTKVTAPFEPKSYVLMRQIMKDEAAGLRKTLDWNWSVNVNFMHVCAGKNLQTEEERKGLKCWLQRKHNPYWSINPLKMEILNRDPPVYQIYDFIGDKLIEKMKKAAVDGLERSTVVDRNDHSRSVVDTTRTSSQVWLYDDRENGKFLLPLTYRMELLSQLTIAPPQACDAYQVASYGPSHHYAPHIDSFEDTRRAVAKGNRIVTIMGYMSHVKAGGRTGFPLLGVAAEPIKGSVVMWYNLKKNGAERDMRTWHGGCPVVFGVKWITNKWVYYNENFRNFPCGLNQDE